MFYEFLFQVDWLPLIYIFNLPQEHNSLWKFLEKI